MAPSADWPAGDALGIRRVEGRAVDPRARGVLRAQEAPGTGGDAAPAPLLEDFRAGHDALRRAHLPRAARPGAASRVSRDGFAIWSAARHGSRTGPRVARTGDVDRGREAVGSDGASAKVAVMAKNSFRRGYRTRRCSGGARRARRRKLSVRQRVYSWGAGEPPSGWIPSS